MKKKIISITTGDLDGVGLEVTIKALHKLSKSNTIFLIFQGRNINKELWKPLPKKITLSTTSLDVALNEAKAKKSQYQYIEILSSDSPANWVKESAQLCLDKVINGMTTGPVSKKTFIDANLDSVGHTPLLSKICSTSKVFMGFLGHSFNVILLSGHIPINQIESSLNTQLLTSGFQVILKWREECLPKQFIKLPLGVLGLNPHNGENGLIGDFEAKYLNDLIQSQKVLKGPLVPDVAFFKENWNKYSFFIALYHDQGLIPFKMIHGRTGGCHVSVGLPIVRTSVDHGTAKDIFGKNIAKPESMVAALKWCETIISRKDAFHGL